MIHASKNHQHLLVEHTFIIDEDTGECQTFRGKIIRQVKVGKDKTFFNIKYEGFEDKYWTYQILQDYNYRR